MKILLPFVLLVELTTSLLAHDFYSLPANFIVAPRTRIEVWLQNGDSFPDSESAPVLARVKDAELHLAAGRVPIEGLKVVGNRAVGFVEATSSPGLVFLAARTAPNFIQLESDKALDYFKEEGLDDVIKWRLAHGEAKKPSRALQDIDLRVGGNIQKLRKQKGITQDQLAEISGLNRAHVYRLESGRQSMTLRTLKIIADALEVRPTQFLTGF